MSRAEAANLVGMAGWRLHGKVRRGGRGRGRRQLAVAPVASDDGHWKAGSFQPLHRH